MELHIFRPIHRANVNAHHCSITMFSSWEDICWPCYEQNANGIAFFLYQEAVAYQVYVTAIGKMYSYLGLIFDAEILYDLFISQVSSSHL